MNTKMVHDICLTIQRKFIQIIQLQRCLTVRMCLYVCLCGKRHNHVRCLSQAKPSHLNKMAVYCIGCICLIVSET